MSDGHCLRRILTRIVRAAGAVTGLRFAWSEYQAVYRTPAGTGVGAGFCVWS
jgi:hypothetical protein